MGKKSSKQPKRTPTAANGSPATKTNPLSSSNDDAAAALVPTSPASPESSGGIMFAKFIKIADVDSIKDLLATAAYRSQESENLECLWDRAFDEGYRKGQQKWEKRAENNYEDGYQAGLKESTESKYRSFQSLWEQGKADEHSEWEAAGHGPHCFAVVAVLETTGTQTEEYDQPQPQKAPSFEAGTQTNLATPTFDAATQSEPPPPISDATSQTEPQRVAATSPSPTLIDCEKIAIPSTIISTAITINTPGTSTLAYPTSKTSKSVGFSPKTPKYGPVQPVPIAPIHPGHSDTPPFDISNPNIPFASTNTKTLTWSDEPCNFDPGKPPSHPPPHAALFGPRDLSVLRSGTDPWKV